MRPYSLPYPFPIGIAVIEERLEVILQPVVVIILIILAKSLKKLFLQSKSQI